MGRRQRASGPQGHTGQLRQTSAVSVTFPEDGTVAVRLAPLSQVTLPCPSLRTYLYANEVPAGRFTSSFQTGYVAGSSFGALAGFQLPRAAWSPVT